MHDAARERLAGAAEAVAKQTARRQAELEERISRLVEPSGNERALDAGCGAGALALALAPHVREVIGVDTVPELLEQARLLAADRENVEFVEGDITQLPFDRSSFDLVGTMRTLHHVRRPELVVAELTRVTRLGGRILVVDQIAPVDPLAAIELDRFERARDSTHTRLLPDADMRHAFEANGLVLLRSEVTREQRGLDRYFELAACTGEAEERARDLAPGDPYTAEIGWYLLKR